jgi:PAS domain-containing protein
MKAVGGFGCSATTRNRANTTGGNINQRPAGDLAGGSAQGPGGGGDWREREVPQEREGTLSQILQGTSIPLFVINREHVVTHWNQACENLTGMAAQTLIGTRKAWTAFYSVERPVLADLLVDQRPKREIVALYKGNCHESPAVAGGYEFEAFFADLNDASQWLFCTAAPLRDAAGRIQGAVETFQNVTERKRVEKELQRRIEELSEAKRRLEVLVLNMTDREKRMVDLKDEVNRLLQLLGRQPKYEVPGKVAQLGDAALAQAD